MTTEEELPDIDAHDVGKKAEEEKIFKPEDVVAVHPGTLRNSINLEWSHVTQALQGVGCG